jgi:hypothetical protein
LKEATKPRTARARHLLLAVVAQVSAGLSAALATPAGAEPKTVKEAPPGQTVEVQLVVSVGRLIGASPLLSTTDGPGEGGAAVAFMNPGGIPADLTYAAPTASAQQPGQVLRRGFHLPAVR